MRLISLLAAVAPQWARLRLDTLTIAADQITVDLSSTARTTRCPDCQRRSHRAHSRFIRVLADLPLGELPVYVRLHARRFRCLNPACPRQTFRERLPDLAPRYQRRTPALRRHLEAVSFALGGQAGRRLTQRLRLSAHGISRNSLLRLIRRASLPSVSEVAPELRRLGVDDFAFRRGLRYGALLVDLDQHCVIDLLPDREAATLAAWLTAHGGAKMEVVSRDRGGAFADGVRQGAPQAVQVADRFHLVRNLGQALDRLLIREHRVLTRVAAALWPSSDTSDTSDADGTTSAPGEITTSAAREAPPEQTTPAVPAPTRVERERAAVDDQRRARYDRVVALAAAGHSLREVARRASVSRETVRTYLRAGQYRPCAPRRRPSKTEHYAAYLRRRWEEGEHNSAVLLLEIREQGYRGAASTLRQYVRTWRTGPRRPGRRRHGEDGANAPPARPRFSPRQTHWLLLRPVEDLTDDERAYRAALCQASAVIATAQRLVSDFGHMVRTRAALDLDVWLAEAKHCRIPELVSFVRGVQRDYAAVTAALSSPLSQGQVEGQVNRIKMLKRQMYGRANFDLLRRRVLYNSA
ncbi:MAG TPA: ISL3 family transposase [Ktedonobacterales bacterium]|nr:ISL3 family transposase [Ktedonobacterales bacterium]